MVRWYGKTPIRIQIDLNELADLNFFEPQLVTILHPLAF